MSTLMLGLALAGSARAATGGEIGLVGGAAVDLPDVETIRHTRFGPGPWLLIPVGFRLNDWAALRVSLRVDWGAGRDRLSWTRTVDGETQRFFDDAHDAWFLGAGITIGPEVRLPVTDRFFLDLGVEAGMMVGWTFHVLGEDALAILDDDAPAGGLDPYSVQPAFLTEVHFGGGVHLSPAVALTLETGYSVAFFGEGALANTDPDVAAVREPFGWNALRAGIGFRVTP